MAVAKGAWASIGMLVLGVVLGGANRAFNVTVGDVISVVCHSIGLGQGIAAVRRVNEQPGLAGIGLAITGIVLNSLLLLVALLSILRTFSGAGDAPRY